MTYVTLSDLTARYGESLLVSLTDRGEIALGTIQAEVVDRAVADTGAVIEGYLSGRYALPLAAPQPLLTDVAVAIAVWKLHTFAPDPKIEADYKGAMATLREIAAGTIRLAAAGVEAAGTGTSGALVTDRERPFTAENLKGFI
uniref:DUF1320 domain-containing protein n=1 Tax=Cereibacter sphaeroides (strain ATCC 17025 / ATH 2.4.3) TaxID=349102 RepID=A4WS43_CERS5